MSLTNMSWVMEHSPYKLGRRLIHLMLATAANDEHDNLVWERQGTIARKAAVSRQTVNETLTVMVADGYLEVADAEEKAALKPFLKDTRVVVYRFLKPARPVGKPDTSTTTGSVGKSDTSGSGCVGLSEEMCRVEASRCVGLSGSDLLLTQEEPNLTQDSPRDFDPFYRFDDFWTLYPKRHGVKVGKAATRELWGKLSITDKAAAYRGAKHLAAAVDADATLPKDPERFLKGRVWEDWQEPPSKPPPRRGPMHRHERSLEEVIAAGNEVDRQYGITGPVRPPIQLTPLPPGE